MRFKFRFRRKRFWIAERERGKLWHKVLEIGDSDLELEDVEGWLGERFDPAKGYAIMDRDGRVIKILKEPSEDFIAIHQNTFIFIAKRGDEKISLNISSKKLNTPIDVKTETMRNGCSTLNSAFSPLSKVVWSGYVKL